MLPRVGHIQYLNCLPLYYGMVKKGLLPNIELRKGTPTELSNLLITGRLDISPIPAIEYCRYSEDLLLLPHLTVSSDGEVKSILIASTVPITELHGKPFALPATSATSQVLARIILEKKYGVKPVYFECPSDLPRMLLEAAAALLIGDDALRTYVNSRNLFLYDLGREWKELSGEKMVYAVWAARKEYAENNREIVKELFQAFMHSLRYSVDHIDEIAREIARLESFTADFLKDYFLSLRFEFDTGYQEGYRTFLRHAQEMGFVQDIPELKFVEVE
jgi:chorismate dehydratase